MKTNKSGYKTVELYLDKTLSDDAKEQINRLNKAYSDDEIMLEITGSKVLIHVHKIDVENVRATIGKINSSNNHEPILFRILDKIESIKSYGLDTNKKRVFVGYNKERKVKSRTEKTLKRGKYFYAKGADFDANNYPLPREYQNQIICGDSEHILRQLPNNCIDLIFTSPPYNFGLAYPDHQDSIDWESYLDKLYRVFDECIRVIKYGGRIIVNVQPLFSDYIPLHHLISHFFIHKQLIWKAEILWEKNNYNCKYTAWGSWKSPSNPYIKYTWEFIEVFCKGQMKKTGNKDKIDITGEEFKQWVYGKWRIAPEKNMKEFNHPSMFPEALAKRVLKLFSYQEDICLDPFMGVGTLPVVAKKNNRYYLGIDISREYCDKAISRLNTVDPSPSSNPIH